VREYHRSVPLAGRRVVRQRVWVVPRPAVGGSRPCHR
jgi:hypothetical protein